MIWNYGERRYVTIHNIIQEKEEMKINQKKINTRTALITSQLGKGKLPSLIHF